jgi:hypothetical protein
VSPAIHAQRIVEAWDCFNHTRFKAELECALTACNSSAPGSELESEEQAVLESVVRQLRTMPLRGDHDASYRSRAGFLLLRHLQAR